MRRVMAGRLGIVTLLALLVAGTAFAAPGDPERRAIRPADQKWARRANLTAKDLPVDFRAGPAQSLGPSGATTCKGFAPDLSDLTITGEAVSRDFVRLDGTSMFSSAEVFRSVRDEHEDWARTAKRQALPCVAQLLERQSTSQVRITVVSKALRAPPAIGERAISFRIGALLTANGVRLKTWMDLIGIARGRADATLVTITFRMPPSAALERVLLGKLARRLRP
jgi:hypothetical protein